MLVGFNRVWTLLTGNSNHLGVYYYRKLQFDNHSAFSTSVNPATFISQNQKEKSHKLTDFLETHQLKANRSQMIATCCCECRPKLYVIKTLDHDHFGCFYCHYDFKKNNKQTQLTHHKYGTTIYAIIFCCLLNLLAEAFVFVSFKYYI